ncbi:MAG: tetratricopeptide repeat protein [Bacteroidetes bacterium]|nr:tetratricopeptide repeat protein [Bacteroidota bacterium]
MRRPRTRYIRLPKRQRRLVAVLLGGFAVLLVNSLFLYLVEGSTALLYMSNVLLHIGLGTVFVLPAVIFLTLHLSKMPLRSNWKATLAGTFTGASLITLLSTGFGLVFLGSTWGAGALLILHVICVATSVIGFVVHVSLKEGIRYRFLEWGQAFRSGGAHAWRHPLSLTLIGGLAVTFLVGLVPWLQGGGSIYVEEMEENPLAASQAILAHEGYLSDEDLGNSESCGQQGCHPDVLAQWEASVHRFSSFNNPYYLKSIEALIERGGNDPARWCASCHDPLVLFTGRLTDEQILDFEHPTSQAGITCFSCHAIEALRDVKGNGRYVISSPDEYPFARANDDTRKWIHNTLLRANPGPHREAMLKPVHQTMEFCGTCHKVGLPPEVNNYRWKRGQNEYDAWQSSGTSGNTVRSFYLPEEPLSCIDCHMPRVASEDQGGIDGFIRSHTFATANTAIPTLEGYPKQVEDAQEMLRSSASVDVFSVTVDGRIYGPNDIMPPLRPGAEVEVTVVVRNRRVGHLLPGGTNDSNEMWLEFSARDSMGTEILISGDLDAKGRVDSTAHFWGAVQVDRASQAINRRNAQDWVATVYARMIGPGTAHTVHYGFRVPSHTSIHTLSARLYHRKFKWYFHNWTFRGRVAPGQPDSLARKEVDLRRWELGPGEAPEIPITLMASSRRLEGDQPDTTYALWERWNDYGIGLFLEGDTRGALEAFNQVSMIAPQSPEGPINLARVHLAEGSLEAAETQLEEAEEREPGFLKTAYFRAEVLRGYGLYDDAITEWLKVYETYPNDRVLLLAIARMHYLMERYDMALQWIDRVLIIDPEDLGGLYNRMLALGALERTEELQEAQRLYEFHKDDETALAVTGPYKQRHPSDNLLAQPIHQHSLFPVQRQP